LIQYLLPFVCLPYVSGVWSRMKRIFGRHKRSIAPVVLHKINREHLQ
jgi:hypothetical protein